MKNIVLLFGGQSSEHEVSCISVVTVANNINTDEFKVHLVGITKQGKWLYIDSVSDIESGAWTAASKGAVLSPDATKKELLVIEGESVSHIVIDVAFSVLHGLYGEDGTVQGLFELAQIPYVGCGVLASAVSMDKVYTKLIVDRLGICQARYVVIRREELCDREAALDKVEKAFPYPVFVKPANAGSSRGVSRAVDREGLKKSIALALAHDNKLLVEETVVGRELECAVLGNIDVRASGVGEILAAGEAEFYDYDAKYNNADSKTVIDPALPEGKREEIRRAAVDIFRAVDGRGLARVDFFLEKETDRVVFNELNTLPGFTSISMYPLLWEAEGIDKRTLIARLITLAKDRGR